jgi:hypothetical protein
MKPFAIVCIVVSSFMILLAIVAETEPINYVGDYDGVVAFWIITSLFLLALGIVATTVASKGSPGRPQQVTTSIPPVPPREPPSAGWQRRFCQACGAQMSDGDAFCIGCGMKADHPSEYSKTPERTVKL